MIKSSYIQEFVTLASTLNFSKTAEQTFITQPALSRHIVELEAELGARLLERSTRTVKLTPAGIVVYEKFCDILKSYSEAKEAAKAISAGISGVLRISSPYYWTEDYTEPVVKYFSSLYPKCRVEIISCQPMEGYNQMLNGESDLALTAHTVSADEKAFKLPFAFEKTGVVMSSGHPLSQCPSVKLTDLDGSAFIFIGAAGYELFNDSIMSLLRLKGITPSKVLYTQQVDTLGLTIEQTGGVSIMPYCVRRLNRSYISTVLIDDPDCVMTMCYLCRADSDNPAVPRFLSSVEAVFPENE